MWNEKTKQLVAAGKLVVIGVVQEQHAERAKLYQQWKQYDFPIAQDAVTSLGLEVVPVPILIDEHGYLMSTRPRINEIGKLVALPTKSPKKPAPKLDGDHVSPTWLTANAAPNSGASSLVIGDSYLNKGNMESIRQAVLHYTSSLKSAESQQNEAMKGLALFRLGVAYRNLFDLAKEDDKHPDDFTKAARFWTLALETNPNQYIWRRRIQQYGPRQIKPYPFYDWIDQAKQEITARGETPVKLKVQLSGAEIAQPNRKFETVETEEKNPDPDRKIESDEEHLINFHATVVPQKIAPGETVRAHLIFVPNTGHWNNEAGEMMVWIDESDSGIRSRPRLVHSIAKLPSSDESRSLEFEFKTNLDSAGEIVIKGYALYYVCKSDDGQCLYRRQDFSIPIQIQHEK